MPPYHSSFNKVENLKTIGNIAILPFKSTSPNSKNAPRCPPDMTEDVIDEVLRFFKANVFFNSYEIKGPADRLLIYLTLYTHQCLLRMAKATSKDGCLREMYQLAIESFPLPTDGSFILHGFFGKVASKSESDELRSYLTSCRHELGNRLAERVCDETGKPSKWWLAFAKRKFLGKALEGPGSR
jgi:actin related protein 2/3 complex subunit 3